MAKTAQEKAADKQKKQQLKEKRKEARRRKREEARRRKKGDLGKISDVQEGVKPVKQGWLRQQGDQGFNALATHYLKRKRLVKSINNSKLKYECADPPKLMGHQQTAIALVKPGHPVSRFLVVHRTGSGKTMTMIKILDNFFEDPRPKVVIFPNRNIRNNFYKKLMDAKDTKWFKFADRRLKELNVPMTQHNFQDVLKFKGALNKVASSKTNWEPFEPWWPAAPLRVFSFSQAGGTGVFPFRGNKASKDRRPKFPIFARYWNGRNSFDSKIILMDEVHNLVVPRRGTTPLTRRNLAMMRNRLYLARDSVVVGLTATPIVNSGTDGTKLVRIIKGEINKDKSDEGFISFFDALPTSVYPRVQPDADRAINTKIVEVALRGKNLERYKKKFKQILGKLEPYDDKKYMKVWPYCQMALYTTEYNNRRFLEAIHNKEQRRSMCTKFDRLVSDVLSTTEKCVVMCKLRLGFKALVRVFEAMDPEGKKHRWKAIFPKMDKKAKQAEGKVVRADERTLPKTLLDFNDMTKNDRGQRIRVLILETDSFGEGIDLFGVRRMYFAHPAGSYGEHKQWVGRVLRACGYSALPEKERDVIMQTYVVTLGNGGNTVETVLLEALRRETARLENVLTTKFRRPAVDKQALGFGDGKLDPETPLIRKSLDMLEGGDTLEDEIENAVDFEKKKLKTEKKEKKEELKVEKKDRRQRRKSRKAAYSEARAEAREQKSLRKERQREKQKERREKQEAARAAEIENEDLGFDLGTKDRRRKSRRSKSGQLPGVYYGAIPSNLEMVRQLVLKGAIAQGWKKQDGVYVQPKSIPRKDGKYRRVLDPVTGKVVLEKIN